MRRLTERVKYGIKEELMPLMDLEQIGRVRARTFYENGYRTAEEVRSASQEELKDLPGVGERISSVGEEKGRGGDGVGEVEMSDESQSSLQDF